MKGIACLLLAPALIALPCIAAENSPQVKRGQFIVQSGGCNDCHTPLRMGAQGPEPDMS